MANIRQEYTRIQYTSITIPDSYIKHSQFCKNMNVNRITCQIAQAVNFGEEKESGTGKSSGFVEFKFCLFLAH